MSSGPDSCTYAIRLAGIKFVLSPTSVSAESLSHNASEISVFTVPSTNVLEGQGTLRCLDLMASNTR